MPDISKYRASDGTLYDLKVYTDKVAPQMSKTYTGVTVTANSDPAGYLYFATILPNDFYDQWKIRYRLTFTLDGVPNGRQISEVILSGSESTTSVYQCINSVKNTSYRPIYNHQLYPATLAGVQAGYGHALGVRFHSAYQPVSVGRTILVEILETIGCSVTLLDAPVTYANLPGTGSTNYSGRLSYDGTTQGYTQTGDRNVTYELRWSNAALAGAVGVFKTTLAMQLPDGSYESIVTSSSAASTGKTVNPHGFLPGSLMYHASGADVSGGTRLTSSSLCWLYQIDIRYSVNGVTTSASTSELVNRKPLYIVGTIAADGLFYLDQTKWWAQNLPASDDGRAYIYIGESISVYQVSLYLDKPILQWLGGKWQTMENYLRTNKAKIEVLINSV